MGTAIFSREYPPDTAWGGVATVYHALAKRGHEVHVICQAVAQPGDHVDDGVESFLKAATMEASSNFDW